MRSSLTAADIRPLTGILETLEDLGTFAANGVYQVRPFRDWIGTSWTRQVFGMRVCNAGDIIAALQKAASYNEFAREKALTLYVLSASIVQINHAPAVDQTQLDTYNQTAHTQLSPQEYLYLYLQNLEDVIIERLNLVYGGLQMKQQRGLRGAYLCDVCAKEYPTLPEGSVFPLYILPEIVCPECQTPEALEQYTFEAASTTPTTAEESPLPEHAKPSSEVPAATESSFAAPDEPYMCSKCEKPFSTFEEFQAHRSDTGH